MNFGLSIACFARPPTRERLKKMRGGAAGFLESLRPLATDFHDLGASNQARAGERAHLRLRVTPAAQRLGPFPDPVERKHALTAVDRGTVDEPAEHRRHLTG